MLNENASLKELIDSIEEIDKKLIDRGEGRTVIPTTTDTTLEKGNYKGDIVVKGDSNLKAENIKKGVNLFGIEGECKNISTLPKWFNQEHGFWITGACQELPNYTRQASSTVIGDNIYILGGQGTDGILTKDNFIRYDTSINMTYKLGDLPYACYFPQVASIGDKIYLIGGRYDKNEIAFRSCFCYSTKENKWTKLKSAPDGLGRYNAGVAVIGDCIYILFGKSFGNTTNKTCLKYDTKNDSWETLASAKTEPREGVKCAVLGTKIYCFGGYDGNTIYDYIDVYDTEKDSWETVGKMRERAKNFAIAQNEKEVYILGGKDKDECCLNQIYKYNLEKIENNSYVKSTPFSRFNFCAECIKGKIYTFGGATETQGYFFTSSSVVFYIV